LEGILAIGALLVCVIPHEVAHGWVAYRLGDPTAKLMGRLSFNPLRHLDPIGSLLVPAFLLILQRLAGFPVVFGWAKPVPINPNYFRDPWRGMMWVGLAGPVTNFVMAIAVAGIGQGLVGLGLTSRWLLYFLALVVLISLVLGIFNLIPVPPLDGSRVLVYFLPPYWRYRVARWERYGMWIVLGLLLIGGLGFVYRLAEGIFYRLVGFHWLALAGLL
jgi:Zn-dependent protease